MNEQAFALLFQARVKTLLDDMALRHERRANAVKDGTKRGAARLDAILSCAEDVKIGAATMDRSLNELAEYQRSIVPRPQQDLAEAIEQAMREGKLSRPSVFKFDDGPDDSGAPSCFLNQPRPPSRERWRAKRRIFPNLSDIGFAKPQTAAQPTNPRAQQEAAESFHCCGGRSVEKLVDRLCQIAEEMQDTDRTEGLRMKRVLKLLEDLPEMTSEVVAKIRAQYVPGEVEPGGCNPDFQREEEQVCGDATCPGAPETTQFSDDDWALDPTTREALKNPPEFVFDAPMNSPFSDEKRLKDLHFGHLMTVHKRPGEPGVECRAASPPRVVLVAADGAAVNIQREDVERVKFLLQMLE